MVEGRVIPPQAQSASPILVARSTTKAPPVNDSGLLLAAQRHQLGASIARDSL